MHDIAINFSPSTYLLDIKYNIFDDLINAIKLFTTNKKYIVIWLYTKKLYLIGLIEIRYFYYNQNIKKRIPTK